MMLPNQFNVMPVRDKKPLISWKRLTEVRQEPSEKSAILDNGAPGNIGIVTGGISNLFVLDIDGPEGEKSIEGKHIPKTWTVKTPRGRHYYFRWTSELGERVTTKVGVLEKVDTRGDGGYVVFYGWERAPHLAPLAAPPQWLIDSLPHKGTREIGAGVVATLGGVKPGNRNASMASLAGGLRARGYSVEEMYAFLEPKAKEVDFPLDELQSVCNSIGRYPAPEAPKVDLTSQSLLEFVADTKVVPFIVDRLIGDNTINILAGLQASKKSWALLDLAVAFASGTPWMSKFKTQQKKTLIIDQERPKMEMQRRIQALTLGRGLQIADLEGQLVPKVGTTFRMNLDQSFDGFSRMLDVIRPEVVLIDSLKAFQSGDITNNQNMQMVFERFKELRTKYGLTFVILHHENKGAFERSREKREVTAENTAGAAVINEVPEGIFIMASQDDTSAFFHHVKNSYGMNVAPFVTKVRDVTADRSSIVVEAF